jgi:hypothetical protein
MVHRRNPHPLGARPIASFAHTSRLVVRPRNLPCHLLQLLFAAVTDHLALAFQVAHRGPLVPVEMVEHLRVSAIAVAREVAWNVPAHRVIDQLDTQRRVVCEGAGLTGVFLLQPPPRNRIVGSRGANIIGDDVIVRHDVALVRMIPEPADVRYQRSRMVHQRVVHGKNAARAGARLGIALPPGQAALVEGVDVPGGLRQPTVQARLVRDHDKLAVDAADGLALRHHQPGQILGTMAPSRFGGTDITKGVQGLRDHRWNVHNGWHEGSLPTMRNTLRGNKGPPTIRHADQIAKLQ